MKPIIFWGATGQAKVLREFINQAGYELVALFDNNPQTIPPFSDVPLYFQKQGFQIWKETGFVSDTFCLVAIGGARGHDRVEIQRWLEDENCKIATLVHPTAFVAGSARLGKGCQILAKAVVGVEAVLGEACIVNTAASVDHEAILGDGVHIAPGATLAGCVSVADYSMIGSGAVILPHIKIGSKVVVGAGAVVTKDVPDGKIVYGNPARIIRDNTF